MKRLGLVGLAAIASVLALRTDVVRAQRPVRAPLEVYFIDVEGGAATLMVTPNRESVLVDCGWPGLGDRDPKRIEHVARYVLGLERIDHFVATHWHTDHYGGIEGLAKRIPIGTYWDHGVPETLADDPRGYQTLISAYRRANGGKSRALKPGDRIPLRDAGMPVELRVVAGGGKVIGEGDTAGPMSCARHRDAPVKDESDNMRSLALHLRYGKFDFLNCGDLTWNIEHKLACPQNRVGKVDLWQVTHHGAPQSGNPALVEAIEPRCAIICNGPRKGGDPRTFATLKKTRSLEGIFQLHRNVTSTPMDNAKTTHIANPEEKCRGEFLRMTLDPSGERYSVAVGGQMPTQTFAVR